MKNPTPLFLRTVALIKAIPQGKVLTYGKVADLILAPGCARHISYILSSSSRKYRLPWHRVIGSNGKISQHRSALRQIKMLRDEGIEIENMRLDLTEHQWKPAKKEVTKILRGIPKHISIFLR